VTGDDGLVAGQAGGAAMTVGGRGIGPGMGAVRGCLEVATPTTGNRWNRSVFCVLGLVWVLVDGGGGGVDCVVGKAGARGRHAHTSRHQLGVFSGKLANSLESSSVSRFMAH
jgi:hypothetical protein